MSQFMRRIVAACTFVGLIASVVPASFAAYTELSAANKLAAEGVIVDQSANPADYRLGQNVLRQEAVGVAGRIKGVIPTTPVEDYDCQDVYSDIDEDWVCRAAELAAENKIVDPVATGYMFNPKRDVTRYEAMVMMMKASCLNPVELGEGDTHVEQTADAAVKAGVIASASSFDPNRAATRGEVFLYAAELWDYSNENPDMQDDSIYGCGEEDDLDLCDLLPDLPGCEDTDPDTDPDDIISGDLEARLSDESPESDNIPRSGRTVYTIFELEAGSEDVEVDSITIERSGNGSEDDFDKILILEDGIPVTGDRSINSDDLAIFTNLNWLIKAGETRTFAIEALMDTTVGKENRLNVVAIETEGGGDVDGLPIIGNEMLTIDYVVSQVEFQKRGSPTTVDVGDEDVIVGEFKLTNNSTEDKDVVLQSIRLENNGSADVSGLENLMLMHDGVEVSDRVVIDGDYVTFVVDGGFTIMDGDSRNFVIKADITSGDDLDTYQFSLSDKFDLRAYEEGSTIGTTTLITDEDLEIYTVDAGRFSISLDTTSPSAEDYARGSDNVLFLVAKVDAGQTVTTQGVRAYLTDSSASGNGTDLATDKLDIEADLDSVRLVVNGSTVDTLDDVTCVPAAQDTDTALENCYYDFDSDFELDDDDLIEIFANIDDNADFLNKYGFSLKATDFSDLEYVESGDNVDASDKSGTAVGKDMTIVAATVKLVRNDGYSSEEFVAGVKSAELLKFLVDAGTSSDITVQRIGFKATVTDDSNNNGISGEAGEIADGLCDVPNAQNFTGFKLYADGVKVGDTEDVNGTGSMGTFTFDGINLDIARNDQSQFLLTGDTATSAAGCDLQIGVETTLTTIDDENGDDITPTYSPAAATFSDLISFLEGGELTATLDGDSQDARIFVANSDGNSLGSFNFYANNDDVELKDLYFRNVRAITDSQETKSDGRTKLMHLVVDGVIVSSASPVAGEVDFSNTGIIVPRNENVTVELTADFNGIDNESKTGAIYGFELSEVEARSSSTGFTLVDSDLSGVEPEGGSTGGTDTLVVADVHLLTKSVPTLTSVDPISGDLSNGSKAVYGVKITADAKGKVAVYSLAFNVSSTGTATLASPVLTDQSGNTLTGYTCLPAAGVLAGASTVIECTYVSGTVESVAAASSKTLYLKGTVAGVDGIGDGLSVQMLQTANTFDIADDNYATLANVYVGTTAIVDAAAVYAIIWTDVASGNTQATGTAQWFGDNEVPGLDTATVTNNVSS